MAANFRRRLSGTDEKTDIAVIKIEAADLPVVQFGDSDAVRVGQFAFAIGAPFKLDYTFTYGVISGKGRSKLIATGGYYDLGLPADRRLDQSGQQRRSALRHRRQSGRHEHAHQRSQSRPRFRHSEQSGQRNRPTADCRAQDHPALARAFGLKRWATTRRSAICSKASTKAWSCARSKPTRRPTKAICGRSM